jgi:hypothetical protein
MKVKLLLKTAGAQMVKNILAFYETQILVPLSQRAVKAPYKLSVEYNLHSHPLFI